MSHVAFIKKYSDFFFSINFPIEGAINEVSTVILTTIIIIPSVGKYCFSNKDSRRYFSAHASTEIVRGLEIVLSNTLGK